MPKKQRTSGPIPSTTLLQRAEEMARTSPTDIAGMTGDEVQSLTNALKHARPKHILIVLESNNGHPTLQVADDGTGFDSSQKNEGMGLKTMQYRASLIGANLSIRPIDTGGTLVTCKVFGGANCDDW